MMNKMTFPGSPRTLPLGESCSKENHSRFTQENLREPAEEPEMPQPLLRGFRLSPVSMPGQGCLSPPLGLSKDRSWNWSHLLNASLGFWDGVSWALEERQEKTLHPQGRQRIRSLSATSRAPTLLALLRTACSASLGHSTALCSRKTPLKQKNSTDTPCKTHSFPWWAFSEHLLCAWGCRRGCGDLFHTHSHPSSTKVGDAGLGAGRKSAAPGLRLLTCDVRIGTSKPLTGVHLIRNSARRSPAAVLAMTVIWPLSWQSRWSVRCQLGFCHLDTPPHALWARWSQVGILGPCLSRHGQISGCLKGQNCLEVKPTHDLCVFWGCSNQGPQAGGSHSRNEFPHRSGEWTSEIRVWAEPSSQVGGLESFLLLPASYSCIFTGPSCLPCLSSAKV